jgi:hypothetical protein
MRTSEFLGNPWATQRKGGRDVKEKQKRKLAERAGFEPAGAFQRRALSKRVP